jgi:hypothetical protein
LAPLVLPRLALDHLGLLRLLHPRQAPQHHIVLGRPRLPLEVALLHTDLGPRRRTALDPLAAPPLGAALQVHHTGRGIAGEGVAVCLPGRAPLLVDVKKELVVKVLLGRDSFWREKCVDKR